MFKIRIGTKLKKRQFQAYLNRVQETQGATMIQDTDKTKTDEAGTPETAMQQIPLAFVCPPGFEPGAYMIIAMDRDGKHYTNAPLHLPHVTLRLATIGLDFASQRAIMHIQEDAKPKSAIVAPAPGLVVPPWRGPEGKS